MAKAAPRLQSRKGARNCGRVRSAASYGITAAGCGAQRRDGNGSIAARTGHFRLPLVRGALGVPGEQSRPGPRKPEAGGSHSPTFPWPHNRIPALPLARTCPPTEILVWVRHTKRAGPAQRPAVSGQRVFFGPRIELKGCDRETPARRASEWLHVPPRSILQALPFAGIQRPPLESSPAPTKTAGVPRRHGLLPEGAPPPVFFVRARLPLPRHEHVSSPEASSRHMSCRFGAIAIVADTDTAEEGCGR